MYIINKLLAFVCIRMALSYPNQKQQALQKSCYKYKDCIPSEHIV